MSWGQVVTRERRSVEVLDRSWGWTPHDPEQFKLTYFLRASAASFSRYFFVISSCSCFGTTA
jgi:hypothetical protein